MNTSTPIIRVRGRVWRAVVRPWIIASDKMGYRK
jgi:hypothetical protein